MNEQFHKAIVTSCSSYAAHKTSQIVQEPDVK